MVKDRLFGGKMAWLVIFSLFLLAGGGAFLLFLAQSEGQNNRHVLADSPSTLTHTTYLPLTVRTTAEENGPLSPEEVSYWAYQLQGINEPGAVEALAASQYDMLVLEPTRTDWSSDDRYFDAAAMVARLKDSRRRLVIAYIDIGEAEDWRWYWSWSKGWDCTGQPPADWPDYILLCDPDGWAGNYPVAYWDPAWQDIIIYGQNQPPTPERDYTSAIDEAIRDGFDGIYLDWVEAFDDETVIAAAQTAGKDPAVEMIAFIRAMRNYATARNPDFVIIQQNAASLLEGHPELLTVIDAIAQEAIWYDGDPDVAWDDPAGHDYIQEQSLTDYYLGYLDQYRQEGVPVFHCEYALTYADQAYANGLAKGYKPYVSRTSLWQLTTTPPPGY